MEAKELRIGNFIRFEDDETTIEKIVVTYQHIRVISKGLAEYKPIPLTKEWFVKFGFKKPMFGHGWENGYVELKCPEEIACSPIDDENDKNLYLHSGGEYQLSEVPVKYVHQLQNIFWCLMGEELTLKHD